MNEILDTVDFEKGGGLVTAIAQDFATGDVLMVAYMNRDALAETLSTGRACYWTRSRQKLWRKGEESGNVQVVKSIYVDCDADAILMKVEQIGGAACHTGKRDCFFREIRDGKFVDVGQQVFDPNEVYKK